MTSIFSAGQSITSIGKSMTAIARVEEHLATFMKKVIYFEKFFQRMGSNLPVCVTDTATLLFQRCYEYRDEIRDELESSVAYVADAGRWVVGMGDWNSKMEKRLGQISELVVLANTLLAEYAVTGEIGSKGSGDDLLAYLQLLAATVTLKNVSSYGKPGGTITTLNSSPPIVQAQPTCAEINSEMMALGSEIKGALSGMFCSKDAGKNLVSLETIDKNSRPQGSDTDDDALNPFAASYQRPVDPCIKSATVTGASTAKDVRSLPDATLTGVHDKPQHSLSGEDIPKGTSSSVSIEEYECLDMDSIPKYAAFKSSTQLAARRQFSGYNTGNNSFAASTSSDGERGAHSGFSTNCNELFPLPARTVSRSLSSLDTSDPLKKHPVEPIMDMNYSYDLQCEVAHNPFISPIGPGPSPLPPEADTSSLVLDSRSVLETVKGPERIFNATGNEMQADSSANQDKPAAMLSAQDDSDHECDLFGVGKT